MESIIDESEAISKLRAGITDAVRSCMRGHAGIALSGGIDSSLVAAIAGSINPDIELYAVGMRGSHDVKQAQQASALLGLGDRLHVCECTDAEIESAIPRVVRAIQTTNPVSVGIGICMYLVSQCAHADGTGLLLTGQGADELFAGYKRYEQACDSGRLELDRELEKDIRALPDQIKRDVAVAELNCVELCLPICNHDVVDIARRIDSKLKMKRVGDEYTRKYILRKVSEDYLPRELAWAPKKAAQYGTGVQNALRRMARRQGVGQAEFLRQYQVSFSSDLRLPEDGDHSHSMRLDEAKNHEITRD